MVLEKECRQKTGGMLLREGKPRAEKN